MNRQARFIRWSLASSMLLSAATVLAFDIAKLPTITSGYISINSDFDSNLEILATPQGCPTQKLIVPSHNSIVVGCAGAHTVKIYILWIKPDGTRIPNEQELPVDTHYFFGWSDDTRSYTRLLPVFDSNGHPTR